MTSKNVVQVFFITGLAFAGLALASPATVWTDSSGNPIKTSSGECVNTGSWVEGVRTICDPEPEPVAAPVEEQLVEDLEVVEEEVLEEPFEEEVAAETQSELDKADSREVLHTINLDATTSFAVGSAYLSLAAKKEVSDLAEDLNGLDNVESIVIEGHTDDTGTEFVNNQLSQQRADRVKGHLIENGVDAGKIIAVGYGSSKPIASNDTEEGRVKNRRVEVFVHGDKLLVKSVSIDNAAAFASGSAWLSLEARESIAELVAEIREMDAFDSLVVEGHTDNTGTDFVNNQLSQQRADRIKEEFAEQGISERSIKARGYGSSKPLESNSTEEGRLKNRRVEIYIYQKP